MLPIVLAVALAVVVAVCVWLIVVVVRQRTARSVAMERMTVLERAREQADDRAASAREERDRARSRAEHLDGELAAATEARDAVETRALVAEAALAASERERDEGAEVRQVLNAELRQATDEVEALRARVQELELAEVTTAGGGDGGAGGADDAALEALWALELARIDRVWRHSVAVGPEASPLEGGGDPLRSAVEIEVAALREETGIDLSVDWGVGPLPPARALVVLRWIQELLAATARSVEEAVVSVEADDADVVVRLRAPSGEDGAASLTGVALELPAGVAGGDVVVLGEGAPGVRLVGLAAA